jgi:hypothetical protein
VPEDRVHDVSAMTDTELEVARRHLMVSLSLAFPGSPVRGPILAHISAIDAELAGRAVRPAPGGQQIPPPGRHAFPRSTDRA